MTGNGKPRDTRPWAFGVILLLAAPAAAQPIAARSRSEPATITLSRSVTVTLTLDAPPPLRVELPEPDALLAPESAKGWRITPLGPATVETVGERELWTRRYKLDPFDVPLDVPTQVAFAPVKVNGRSQTWPPVSVTVQTVWKKPGEVKPDDAHPVTGIEELPTPPTPDPTEVVWVLIGGAAVVFVAVLVVGVIRRKFAAPPPLPPREWALAELDLADRTLTARPLADRIADVLRVYAEAQHQFPAPRLTTAELVGVIEGANWPPERVDELRGILERCDRAKFAGAEPDAGEGHDLVARAKAWVADNTPSS